jgi:pyruvate-formate lyase
MNSRVKKLREALRVDIYPPSTEKACLITESYKTTDGEPQIMMRAKALANILDNITIFIEDDELIVGNVCAKPTSGPAARNS